MGHGVSVVLERLASELRMLGWDVHIASSNCDDSNLSNNVHRVYADFESVQHLAKELECSIVIAVTSPFFEMLPLFGKEFKTVAYEMGDPTPELFPIDGETRRLIAENKRINVYPYVDKVLTISEFLRHDIKWLRSEAIHLGCDHVSDRGTKGLQDFSPGISKTLRLGTLMRLGEGESNYKGLTVFEDLKLKLENENIEFHIMGKGTVADRNSWENKGYIVHLNASDDERSSYLRELDVFFSPSLWEGFNLPLVEAQASGTVALALDVGAHPEVTPYALKDVDEIANQIRLWINDFDLLKLNSAQAYYFVRRKFIWSQVSKIFSDRITSLSGKKNTQYLNAKPRGIRTPFSRHLSAGLKCLNQHGFFYTARLVWNRFFRNRL